MNHHCDEDMSNENKTCLYERFDKCPLFKPTLPATAKSADRIKRKGSNSCFL